MVIGKLDEESRRMLELLINYLRIVVSKSSINLMTPTNIGLVVKECVCVCFMNLVGIVFGPNVMKPLDKKMLTDVGYTHKCNAIMTAILQLESFGEMRRQ